MDLRHLLTNDSPTIPEQILRWFLRLCSLPYALIIRLRNLSYDRGWRKSTKSNLPIISIGNLSAGGTGKSPLVAWLARWFRTRGVRVAILSRGYGQLDSGQNDEALELELQLPDVPHLQHWDRIASAKLAEEELDMQLLLLDDGFQHRRLQRDLELVLLDATDSVAARWLLPGGLMREPLSSLARADVVILSRVNQIPPVAQEKLRERVHGLSPQALILGATHQPANLLTFPDRVCDTGVLQGKRILAFCAIGNPNSFFRSLRELGAETIACRTWRDHHVFTAADIAELTEWTLQFPAAECIVCTMKDWVKIQQEKLGGLDLCALQIYLQFESETKLLEEKLASLLPR